MQYSCFLADKSKTHIDITDGRFGFAQIWRLLNGPNQFVFLCGQEQNAQRGHRCAFWIWPDLQTSKPKQFLFLCRPQQNAHRRHRCASWIWPDLKTFKPNQFLTLCGQEQNAHRRHRCDHVDGLYVAETCRWQPRDVIGDVLSGRKPYSRLSVTHKTTRVGAKLFLLFASLSYFADSGSVRDTSAVV